MDYFDNRNSINNNSASMNIHYPYISFSLSFSNFIELTFHWIFWYKIFTFLFPFFLFSFYSKLTIEVKQFVNLFGDKTLFDLGPNGSDLEIKQPVTFEIYILQRNIITVGTLLFWIDCRGGGLSDRAWSNKLLGRIEMCFTLAKKSLFITSYL